MADTGTPPPRHAALPTGALLDALFANAPIGLAFWDHELRYQRINAVLAGMNGLPVQAHLGRRPSEVLPGLGERLEETFRRVLETGEPLRDAEIAGETPAAPGVERHWLASYFPVQDGPGDTVGITGLVVEVTGERAANLRAEEAVQRSAFVDAELRALYSALPVGVAFLSTDLRYQRVNETLARMNGRAVDDHLGASLEEVLGEPAGMLTQALEQVIATRQPLEIEASVALPHDAQAVRSFEAIYFPVSDVRGELLGLGGVVRDVTDRHELEEEQSRLLREALLARAAAEAAQVRADDAREEAERARTEAERARARTALLARASREMTESIDLDATLRAVVRSPVPAIADWAALTVVEPSGQLRVIGVAHTDPEREKLGWELVRRYPPDPAAPVGTPNVIRTGELELVPDITPDRIRAAAQDPEHLRLLQTLNVRHSVIAPLQTRAGVIGALSFVLGDSDRRFSPGDLDLITSLAARAALHIQNAQLYDERSRIAQTLQASLRPRALPSIPGADIAARFEPAGDQNEVGGDFYEAFPTDDGAWTVIVGDVSGKGAEAAAITALARHTLRTASMLNDAPAANLGLLNRALYADSRVADFCTVVYARLCTGESGLDFRLSNGGHPAPLLLRSDGTVEAVESGRGPLVGVMPAAEYAETTIRLAPGELLLMYTDGVTEIRTSDIALGERELRLTLAAHAGASAEEVVDAVQRRAVDLQAGSPRDDIALVAIKADADAELR